MHQRIDDGTPSFDFIIFLNSFINFFESLMRNGMIGVDVGSIKIHFR